MATPVDVAPKTAMCHRSPCSPLALARGSTGSTPSRPPSIGPHSVAAQTAQDISLKQMRRCIRARMPCISLALEQQCRLATCVWSRARRPWIISWLSASATVHRTKPQPHTSTVYRITVDRARRTAALSSTRTRCKTASRTRQLRAFTCT